MLNEFYLNKNHEIKLISISSHFSTLSNPIISKLDHSRGKKKAAYHAVYARMHLDYRLPTSEKVFSLHSQRIF